MKLKNFKKRIFLIDEFQAASPSQYYTLVNILNEFCKRYDSYAIISTAPMPCFDIGWNKNKNTNVVKLFKKQFYPKELLNDDVFNYNVFNRYIIKFMGEVNPTSLHAMVNKSEKSTLLIVNTIRTSQLMYTLFMAESSFQRVYLLNAHICPADRLKILNNIFDDLKQGIKLLVISTQVIKAGVDISFPVVYRDAAPPSCVVRASGHCNRNGEFKTGNVYVFLYRNNNETRYDCDMVYHTIMDYGFREKIKNKIPAMTEIEFHDYCKTYFTELAKDLNREK